MIVALESSHFQAYILTLFCRHGTGPSGGRRQRLLRLPKERTETHPAQAAAGAPLLFFLYRPAAKEEITSPSLYHGMRAGTHGPSLSFPVNKLPFVHAACLLAWIGVGILALPPKGYCQFIKRLFILWGSAGREVQVTRRRGSSVHCVPHKSAEGFSFSTGYLASVLCDRSADSGGQSP